MPRRPKMGSKISIFPKLPKIAQKLVIGVFAAKIFVFGVKKIQNRRFDGRNHPQIMRCYILKNWIFSYFLGVFAPQRPKKVIFRKKVKLTQNHFLGLFSPEIYDFEVKNTKKHRFGGQNDPRFG